jgi:hypothetical protein
VDVRLLSNLFSSERPSATNKTINLPVQLLFTEYNYSHKEFNTEPKDYNYTATKKSIHNQTLQCDSKQLSLSITNNNELKTAKFSNNTDVQISRYAVFIRNQRDLLLL